MTDFLEIPSEILSVGEFSPSALDVYRKCPKAWEFSYVQNLKHKGRKRFFDKGNYVHELMHVYYQLLQQPGMKPGSDLAIAAIRSKIAQDIAMHANAGNVDIYNDVARTMASYLQFISPMQDTGMTVEAVELFLKVDVTLPSGRQAKLVGIIDEVYRTPQGRIIIRDHKSGEQDRWSEEKVRASHQLLQYGAMWLMSTGECPERVEVNFCNTHNYAKPKPPIEMFHLYKFEHPEITYRNFWESTLRRIDNMLDSPIEPLYSEDCARCPFWPICKLRIRGIDTTHIEKNFYEVTNRDYTIRRESGLSTDNPEPDKKFVIHFAPPK